MAFLNAKSISMQFGGLLAVDNFSFYIDEGEIVSLIGPNGAGKTTVFNMITGVYKTTSGTMEFKGHILDGKTPQEIVALGYPELSKPTPVSKNARN